MAAGSNFFLLSMALATSGCSINGIGLVSSEVLQADGARVICTRTYGIALRTNADDAGIAIGYTSTLAVMPDSPGAPRIGRYPFGIATPHLSTVAEVRRVAGIDLDANRVAIGLMLGFSEDAAFIAIDADQAIIRRIVLTPDNPTTIALRQCRGAPQCE